MPTAWEPWPGKRNAIGAGAAPAATAAGVEPAAAAAEPAAASIDSAATVSLNAVSSFSL
jgi:hypothetical protein